MSDQEYVDFHAVVKAKGWEAGTPAKVKCDVLAVLEGPDSLVRAVGRERTISVFETTKDGEPIDAFDVLKSAAVDGAGNLEVKGFARLTTNKENKPVTYLTAQKARPHEGDVPGSVAPSGSSQNAPSGSGAANGRGMTDEDRHRIVACWALEQARFTVLGTIPTEPPPDSAPEAVLITRWARWYAEQVYRAGKVIGDLSGEWSA